MLYELRHYDLVSDRARLILDARFEQYTLPIWKRIGIEAVGFWWVFIGGSPRMTYMLCWESLAERERLWNEFERDEEWCRGQAESVAQAGYNPVTSITSSILRPAEHSFEARQKNQPSNLAGGIFELRTLVFEDSRDLALMLEWDEKQGQAAMECHGMFRMGVWTTLIGVSPRLTYMLVFEDLTHRERAWAGYHTDPDYRAMEDGLYPGGRALIARTESCLMRGTEFSGWR